MINGENPTLQAYGEANAIAFCYKCTNNSNVESMIRRRVSRGVGDIECYDLVTMKFKGDNTIYQYRFYNKIKQFGGHELIFDETANGTTKSGYSKITFNGGDYCSITVRPNNNGGEAQLYYKANADNEYLFEFDLESTQIINGTYNNANQPQFNYNNNNNNSVTYNETCTICDGRGWIEGSSTATYGDTSQYYCNECGKIVNSSHSHNTCPGCNGKGYTTRIRY